MRSKHRVIIWASSKRGIPITCACGWSAHATTRLKAVAMKRAHLDAQA